MNKAIAIVSLGAVLLGGFSACGPDFQASANRLRARTIAQDKEIADLKQKVTSRDTQITGLQAQVDEKSPRVQTLPEDRLAELFTAARLEIQKGTSIESAADSNGGKPTLRVMLRTLTDDGMLLPTTGTLTIDAFVLTKAPAAPVRLGTWTFTPAEMKKQWYNGLGLNHFAVDCPLASPAPAGELVVKATLNDALTGRQMTAELHKQVAAGTP